MIRSIRWRILLWHGAILVAVVASFGAFFYVRLRQARFREIDTELVGVGQSLVAVLSSLPPHELERDGPLLMEPPPPELEWLARAAGRRGPDRDFEPRRPPPPRDHMERLDRILDLPAAFVKRYTLPGTRAPYFLVWRPSGELLKASAEAPDVTLAEILPTSAIAGEGRENTPPPVFYSHGQVHEVLLAGPSATYVLVGRSIEPELGELRQWLTWLLVSGGSLLVLGLAGGYWLSAGAVRSIRLVSRTAAAISAKNLGQRIRVNNIDRELAPLAETLNRTWARLEVAFERQSRFTADASHELRTPLTVILGHLELALQTATGKEDHHETLVTCQRAARRMKSLVEGLLFLARADAGELGLQNQRLNMGPVVQECAELLAPLARERRVQLTCHASRAEVNGDARLLAQVASNLITNAIRYNRPEGTVHVSVTANDYEAILSVADSGVGMAEADQAHVFERFYRVDQARARDTGGTGLGLAITRGIVEAHGGEIELTSELGRGSEFLVRLPLANRETGAAESRFAMQARATLGQAVKAV